MPKIKTNQVELYYEVHGHGEPLVLLSGFNTSHHVFNSWIDVYKKNFQVIVFDHRGTGASSAPEIPYTIEMMADDVMGLCDALHLERCHFIGGSMGAFILLNVASRFPQRCKKIILANNADKLDPRTALLLQQNLDLLKLGVDQKLVVKTFWPWLFSKSFLSQPNIIEKLEKRLEKTFIPFPLAGYAGHLHAVLHVDAAPWLSNIKAPTLVIGSDEDLMIAEKEVRALAQKIKGATYHCFSNMGHAPHLEIPDAFHRVVLEFLCEN